MPATVFTLLKKDHAAVKKIFAQIEKLESGAVTQKARLFKQLKTELDIHAKLEEVLLYPLLKAADTTHKLTLESYEEHHLVEKLLIELSTQSITEEWDAKLTVLRENVEHHVEEEEDCLFPMAQKVLDRETLTQLGKQLQIEKKKLEATILTAA